MLGYIGITSFPGGRMLLTAQGGTGLVKGAGGISTETVCAVWLVMSAVSTVFILPYFPTVEMVKAGL